MTLTARPAELSAGVYHGLVEVDPSSGVSRFITVALNVRPASETPAPSFEPGGLIFVAPSGGPASPGSQFVSVWTNQADSVTFRAAASTADAAEWLAVDPVTGSAPPTQGVTLEAGVNSEGLPPGIYHGLTSITFEDAVVPGDCLLGPRGEGFKVALNILNAGRHGLAASCIGQAKLARELAIAHACEREQFGRPIAEFGMVQRMIAAMDAALKHNWFAKAHQCSSLGTEAWTLSKEPRQ